jgi:hypothetical protein
VGWNVKASYSGGLQLQPTTLSIELEGIDVKRRRRLQRVSQFQMGQHGRKLTMIASRLLTIPTVATAAPTYAAQVDISDRKRQHICE